MGQNIFDAQLEDQSRERSYGYNKQPCMHARRNCRWTYERIGLNTRTMRIRIMLSCVQLIDRPSAIYLAQNMALLLCPLNGARNFNEFLSAVSGKLVMPHLVASISRVSRACLNRCCIISVLWSAQQLSQTISDCMERPRVQGRDVQ